MKTNEIVFPKEHSPATSPIHVRNELFIPADADRIWAWLTHAVAWPDFYDNASQVVIDPPSMTRLQSGSTFSWTTFNTNIKSEVKEFEPNKRLAWTAKGIGLSAYHSWLIVPQNGGCLVITEETQKGWLPSIARWFIKRDLLKQHQLWLEGLKQKLWFESVHNTRRKRSLSIAWTL